MTKQAALLVVAVAQHASEHGLRVGQQALRRVELQHLARAQHEDAVEVDDGLQTVRDRQHRRTVLPRIIAENYLLTRQSRYKR